MSTQQNSLVTVTVAGRVLGVFDRLSGGDTTAEPAKRRPGGHAKMRQYGALPDYDDVTVGRDYELERDHELIRWLDTVCGIADAEVSDQRLTPTGVPWGKARTWIGMLSKVTTGEVDAMSGDPREWEMTVQVAEKR